MKFFLLAGIAWWCLMLAGCSDNVAGGASEAEATFAYLSNGEPAAGPRVSLIDAENWLAKSRAGEPVVLDSTTVNGNGGFGFSELPSQEFHVQIDADEEGAFVQNAALDSGTVINLSPFAVMQGTVQAQSGELQFVLLEGTNYAAAVDAQGNYTFPGVPEDEYEVLVRVAAGTATDLVMVDKTELASGQTSVNGLEVCGNDIGSPGSDALIQIENLGFKDTVGYQLLLMRGTLASSAESISVTLDGSTSQWPSLDGKFKASVMLQEGDNNIALSSAGNTSACVTVNYAPRSSGEYVRLAYLVGTDSQVTFQAPAGEPDDTASARNRLALGGLMAQTAFAELMYTAGQGRKTFRLEREAGGRVAVTMLQGSLTTDEYRAMTDGELEDHWIPLLEGLPEQQLSKNIGVLSMTRYAGPDSIEANHYAGSGSRAMMGGGSLHTWSEGLEQVVDRFSDQRKVADFNLSDHSDSREEFWANYSTGNGLFLYWLSLLLGAENTSESDAVRSRGMDHFNRLFMLTEQDAHFADELIHFTEGNAQIMNASPWVE